MVDVREPGHQLLERIAAVDERALQLVDRLVVEAVRQHLERLRPRQACKVARDLAEHGVPGEDRGVEHEMSGVDDPGDRGRNRLCRHRGDAERRLKDEVVVGLVRVLKEVRDRVLTARVDEIGGLVADVPIEVRVAAAEAERVECQEAAQRGVVPTRPVVHQPADRVELTAGEAVARRSRRVGLAREAAEAVVAKVVEQRPVGVGDVADGHLVVGEQPLERRSVLLREHIVGAGAVEEQLIRRGPQDLDDVVAVVDVLLGLRPGRAGAVRVERALDLPAEIVVAVRLVRRHVPLASFVVTPTSRSRWSYEYVSTAPVASLVRVLRLPSASYVYV